MINGMIKTRRDEPITPGDQATTAAGRARDSESGALLAHPPVDPLAQQVGVAVVPGVLLHHVHHYLAQRDRSLPGIVPDDVEIGRLGHEPIRERDLGPPHVPCLGDNLGVDEHVGSSARAAHAAIIGDPSGIHHRFSGAPASERSRRRWTLWRGSSTSLRILRPSVMLVQAAVAWRPLLTRWPAAEPM